MWFQKQLGSTSAWVFYCKFAGDLQNTFLEKHLWVTGSVFCIICFGASNKYHILQTSFYNLQTRICRLIKDLFMQTDQKPRCNWSAYIFLFQFLVKQIFVGITEAVPRRWSITVINVKKNSFMNNGQMSWGYFSFIFFSFDQILSSPKYSA